MNYYVSDVLITFAIIAVITVSLGYAYKMDEENKYFRGQCEAKQGMVIVSSTGLVCVSNTILIQKQ